MRPCYESVHGLELDVVRMRMRILRVVLCIQRDKVPILPKFVFEELVPRHEEASSSDKKENLESCDGKHDENCNDSCFVHSEILAKGEAWCRVGWIRHQTQQIWCEFIHVVLGMAGQCIKPYEDDSEEYDINENYGDNGYSSPLEVDNGSHPLVNRSGGSSAYAGGVRQASTALSLRSVIGKLTHVYFCTINESEHQSAGIAHWEKRYLRGDLNQHRTHGDSQQWAPEVAHRMRSVDMADISESETDPRDGYRDGEEYCGDRPTEGLGPVEELLPWCDVPAYARISTDLIAQQGSTHIFASASREHE